MEPLMWKAEYNLGIEIIDNQHKRIMQIINNLQNSVAVENGSKIIAFILDDLLEYTYYHFETEEGLLNKSDNSFIAHKITHDEIINVIISLKDSLIEEKQTLTEDKVEYFRNWWLKHILEGDKSELKHVS